MWKKQAEALFFIEHMQIGTIAAILGISRQSISEHLNEHEDYKAEMAQRRKLSAAHRKEYQREWDRKNRPNRYDAICGESIRREHELAALVLSKEKY